MDLLSCIFTHLPVYPSIQPLKALYIYIYIKQMAHPLYRTWDGYTRGSVWLRNNSHLWTLYIPHRFASLVSRVERWHTVDMWQARWHWSTEDSLSKCQEAVQRWNKKILVKSNDRLVSRSRSSQWVHAPVCLTALLTFRIKSAENMK